MSSVGSYDLTTTTATTTAAAAAAAELCCYDCNAAATTTTSTTATVTTTTTTTTTTTITTATFGFSLQRRIRGIVGARFFIGRMPFHEIIITAEKYAKRPVWIFHFFHQKIQAIP